MSNALVEIEKTVNVQLVEIAQRLYIVDVKTQAKAQNFILNLRAEKSKALEALNPQCDTNYAAWQVSLKQRKKYTEILDRAEEIAKGKLTDYVFVISNILRGFLFKYGNPHFKFITKKGIMTYKLITILFVILSLNLTACSHQPSDLNRNRNHLKEITDNLKNSTNN